MQRLTELTKKFDALTAKVEGLEAENANLKQNEAAIADIKNHNAELLKAKANMLQQDGALRLELSAAKDDRKRAEAEIKSLKEHLDEHAGKMKDLELRNSNLLSDRADMERVLKELQVLKSEKLKLTTTLEGMRANAAVPLMSDEEKSALMETISGLERQKTDLETSRQECLDLAKVSPALSSPFQHEGKLTWLQRSYQEYKQMKPTFDQAEQYRKDALTKDGVIKSLKLELSAAKTSASNGGGPSADAVYWKDKYESLLANIDG
jgi:DNA repair exonuclease SbcCD ATPase subunit